VRRNRLLPTLACLGQLACATLTPRFSQDVATAYAQQPVRKLETEDLEVYYPAQYAAVARRFAGRLEQCVGELREYVLSPTPRGKVLAYLTDAEFNNAYMSPLVTGSPQFILVPVHLSLEEFEFFGTEGTDAGSLSCHEVAHFIHFQQVDGFWRFLNGVTGGLLTPQSFNDPWIIEGLAVYYEGRLGRDFGRSLNPYWRGALTSGTITESSLNPGFLSPANRLVLPFGGHYLLGMGFVEYLASHYGENALWRVVDKQGRSIFSPFGLTLRFRSIYKKSIGALFDDYAQFLRGSVPVRRRPAEQRVLADDLGYFARLAAAPDGTLATIDTGVDKPPTLILRDGNGEIRLQKSLTQILPFRSWIVASPATVSGMSFSPNSQTLYFLGADLSARGDYTAYVYAVNTRTGSLDRISQAIKGLGGCLTADGKSYVYVELLGDTANLVRLNLATGTREQLTDYAANTSLAAPACAQHEDRIAFAARTEGGIDLYLREPDGAIRRLTHDGQYNYAPKWVDESHLLFVHSVDARPQAALLDLTTLAVESVTDAPYVVQDAVPVGHDAVAFLNREAWHWTLDSVPLVFASTPLKKETSTDMEAPAQPADVNLTRPEVSPVVLSDKRYSPFDHFFVPVLHAPYALFFADANTGNLEAYFGVSLAGADRLAMHDYAINLQYGSGMIGPAASIAYGNYQLAPWYLVVAGAISPNGPQWNSELLLTATRTYWTSPIAVRFHGFDFYTLATNNQVLASYRFFGPGISASYFAGESTPYAGYRLALGLNASADYYPAAQSRQNDVVALTSQSALSDLLAGIVAIVPPPLSRRHSLRLSATGRILINSQAHNLLTIGGLAASTTLFSEGVEQPLPGQTSQASSYAPTLAPGTPFRQALVGYEDMDTPGMGVAILSALYRYPLIVDYGWASLFYLLPSFFVRQLELQLFGDAAWITPNGDFLAHAPLTLRRAAGGAVFLRMTLEGTVALSLFYRFARRFDSREDEALLHLFGLALE
jgi:hypothetical protein